MLHLRVLCPTLAFQARWGTMTDLPKPQGQADHALLGSQCKECLKYLVLWCFLLLIYPLSGTIGLPLHYHR